MPSIRTRRVSLRLSPRSATRARTTRGFTPRRLDGTLVGGAVSCRTVAAAIAAETVGVVLIALGESGRSRVSGLGPPRARRPAAAHVLGARSGPGPTPRAGPAHASIVRSGQRAERWRQRRFSVTRAGFGSNPSRPPRTSHPPSQAAARGRAAAMNLSASHHKPQWRPEGEQTQHRRLRGAGHEPHMRQGSRGRAESHRRLCPRQ